MSNIGEYIREQRESRKLTIEELSKKTLISPAVLRDIEAGKFDRYTGEEAYVKMYLKKISNALDMDAQGITQEYVALTQEIELEKLKVKEENEDKNIELVNKGKKVSFSTPPLTKSPSVYEEKVHLKVIQNVIILVLVCLIVGVIWFGLSSANRTVDDPDFKPSTGTNVEGNLGEITDPNANNNQTPPMTNQDIIFNRLDRLSFEMTLPENVEDVVLKIEFGSKSWSKLSINKSNYEQFEAKTYLEGDIVELTFKKSELQEIDLRNGYNMGHKYYINGQEVPLIEEDQFQSPGNFKVVLK